MYSAAYDYKAQYQSDLSLNSGEPLLHIREQKEGWIIVSNKNGEIGIAHKTYLTELQNYDLELKKELLQVALVTLSSDSSKTMSDREKHREFVESELSKLMEVPDMSAIPNQHMNGKSHHHIPSPTELHSPSSQDEKSNEVEEDSRMAGKSQSPSPDMCPLSPSRLQSIKRSLRILDCLREETGASHEACAQGLARILQAHLTPTDDLLESAATTDEPLLNLLVSVVDDLPSLQKERWSVEDRVSLYEETSDWRGLQEASSLLSQWYDSLNERSWYLHQSTLETRLHLEQLLLTLTSVPASLVETWVEAGRFLVLHQLAAIYQAETQQMVCRALLRVLLAISMLPRGTVRRAVCHELMMSVLPGTMLHTITGSLNIHDLDPVVVLLILKFLTHLMLVGTEIQPILRESLTSSTLVEVLHLADTLAPLFRGGGAPNDLSESMRRISMADTSSSNAHRELHTAPGVEYLELMSCELCPASLLRHRAPLYHQLWTVEVREAEGEERLRDAVQDLLLAFNTYLPPGRNAVTEALLSDLAVGGAFCNRVQMDYCRSKVVPRLLWKLLRDMNSDSELAEVLYSTDREVMVGLVTRCIEDYGATAPELSQLLQILEGVVQHTNFMTVGGRKKEEIAPTLRGLLNQHGDHLRPRDLHRATNLLKAVEM